MHRPPHILNASTNLLGICFVIVTGLRLASADARSWTDEIVWVATLLLFVSAVNAYLAIRNHGAHKWQLVLADWTFLGGMSALALAVVIAAIYL